jgi:hypothetical protein
VNGGGVNTLYFDSTTSTVAQAHAKVATFWQSVRNYMSTTLSYTVDGQVDTIDPASGLTVGTSSVASVSQVGADPGDPLPPYVQALIRLRTGVYNGGREVRGRIFIPGMVETSNLNGVPVAAMITAYNGYAATLASTPTAILSVYSKTKGVEETVSSTSTWTKWAMLRSRRD